MSGKANVHTTKKIPRFQEAKKQRKRATYAVVSLRRSIYLFFNGVIKT